MIHKTDIFILNIIFQLFLNLNPKYVYSLAKGQEGHRGRDGAERARGRDEETEHREILKHFKGAETEEAEDFIAD